MVGRIANLASQQELSNTHASNEITHYIMFVAAVGIVLGAIWFFFAFLINYVWLEVIYIFIGMVFAWVPEALASVITVRFTYCMAVSEIYISCRASENQSTFKVQYYKPIAMQYSIM